jgi:formylglycine-generating enzyme required for sulfatase activity
MLTALFLSQTFLFANNIQVNNVRIVEQNIASKYTMIEFDVSWENSWRTSSLENNWDAAWIFAKYRKKGETVWNHVYLNDSGHIAPAGSEITPGFVVTNISFDSINNPAVGVFLYRDSDGVGNVNYTDVQLRWNYGVNGLDDKDSVELSVLAIEMVYIPTGPFYAGDGVFPGSDSRGHFVAGNTTRTFKITSEAAITINNNASTELWGDYTPYAQASIGQSGMLSAQFPKGYQSFYIMKYELSQYMYKEFLNKLTRKQQAARVSAITTGMFMSNTDTDTVPQFRNSIRVMSDPGDPFSRIYGNDLNGNGVEGEMDDGQHIACNWISFWDLTAFADWCGLRPFTELEYEKACRGHLLPVANEYAWGTTNIFSATQIINPGEINEVAINPIGKANIANGDKPGVQGPVRCGSFAGTATTREQAGAGYYGVMEMSGNLLEYTYSVGIQDNREFNGNNHGDGIIMENGDGNANWPTSAGIKGSNWLYNTAGHHINFHQISSRNQTSQSHTRFRYNTTGLRLGRTQP